MAGGGAWGIDIGQCGLKALKCSFGDRGAVVAEAFDYIEYPKILSQPDADPEQLVRDALKEFLSRNNLRGSVVGISVSGQSGLARFIKLPPVESKKVPDIVKYEARQQIPFALEDVVWDYQQMPGGNEEDGFAMETEVGLFAMKRDQLFRVIEPLVDADVEIDIIQLTPLCIYNAVTFDILNGDAPTEYDPEHPPESLLVLSMGTDTSDLVITNGFRVWQRSIPLGGNHFTKQLMKEMKLTFAKAEHLKRNARDAEDPKAVFQAMRSVFSDLVTEVQRSIGYFQNIDKTARLGRIVVLGNATKLPGLPQYLSKNLEREVISLSKFERLGGDAVISAPAFVQNIPSFAVCYGLGLQGLKKAKLATNLVPREIVLQRIVRQKKPWAAAVVGLLLLGCAFNYFFQWNNWNRVRDDYATNGTSWTQAMQQVSSLESFSRSFKSKDEEQLAELERLTELGLSTVSIADGRLLWLELLRVINESLPENPQAVAGEVPTLEERPLATRPDIHIQRMESEFFTDLESWYTDDIQNIFETDTLLAAKNVNAPVAQPSADGAGGGDATPPGEAAVAGEEDADAATADSGANTDAGTAPTGPGWVVEIWVRHYHNDPENPPIGAEYVRRNFLVKLLQGSIELPVTDENGNSRTETFSFKELGIGYPVIATYEQPRNMRLPNPDYVPKSGARFDEEGLASGEDPNAFIVVRGQDSLVQFCWQQTPASVRLQNRLQAMPSGGTNLAMSEE